MALTLFDRAPKLRLMDLRISPQTLDTLDRYFLHGLEPGHFIFCVLTNDLYNAVLSADQKNRHLIYEITMTLLSNINIPISSYGTRENCCNWIANKNNIRTDFVTKYEKEIVWNTLKA
jgi:hypothetical protein